MVSDIADKLRLKEMAEEDVYFAQHDLELIEALHQRRLARLANCVAPEDKERAKSFEDRYRALQETHEGARHETKGRELLHGLQALLNEIKRACRHGD
ncbi:hypothetical protein Thimo_0771 [Thioflavicoccus mobilis 8321]|uniref:Uncharacterized protein n=1 Tax=Thioflavicoccus mobilis 8321 TaxID=765912 RepID=L0GW56_9GAMM|nr:hypothetical protein [Thioflavicoccus mobilis]AGA89610.1 hypothetical protein Thimo_0771 [Thioflavicoccus mobilis 8321]